MKNTQIQLKKFNNKVGIYIHIPFCLSKCKYCDFVSFTNLNSKMERYVKKLCEEIQNTKINEQINTIFIGGGTPTVLNIHLIEEIVNEVFKKNIIEDYEFTIECNPETVNKEYLQSLINLGINRISFGLQSCNNEMLKLIGRAHSFEKFVKVYCQAREVGFNNINVDLMYNLPNQDLEDWVNTINKVLELSPEHISAYSLIIEEGTQFHSMLENNEITIPNEDLYVQFNEVCFEMLSKHGYNKYEVSNYAKNNKECKHNIIYWDLDDYYGFGLNAHSKVSNVRYSNTSNINEYLGDVTKVSEENLSIEEREEEFIFLGLRKTMGISKEKYKYLFNKDFNEVYGNIINELEKEKYVIDNGGFIKISQKGFHILDAIILKILQ